MRRTNFTGEKIGPYYVRERIGQGGMADVYRAYQPTVRREVALKVIPLSVAAEQSRLESRFKQEAEIIAALEHPHILPVFDYGVSDDVLYLATRYLRDGTLRDLLDRGPVPLDQVAGIFSQVASALGYAHRRGVVHRDLKPSNILLDDERNVYLADFGLAKVLGEASQLSTTGSVTGTPAYMSPEQLRGDPVSHRSDIYSLGVILYQMVVGCLPFEAMTAFSLIYQHIEKEPPSPRKLNPDIPAEVEEILLRSLQKNADDRYESAGQMAHALDIALGHEPAGPTPVLSPSPGAASLQEAESPASDSEWRTPASSQTAGLVLPVFQGVRRPRRPGWMLALLGIAAVFALVGALLLLQRSRPPLITPATIVPDEGTPEDVIPTRDEIALAHQALGEQGFIAYITCNLSSEFFATQARRMSDQANRYGLPFRIYDSETDPNEEIIQIERARTDGARALIVCVLDESILRRTLASVTGDGLPLVLQNIGEPPEYGGMLVRHDDYQLGLVPGRYAGKLVNDMLGGRANAVILDYPDLLAIVRRADGLQDGLQEVAADATIVGRYRGGTADLAEESIRRLLEQGADFDVILSINDAGAYGAIRALEAAGVPPDQVIITGVDAEAVAQDYVQDGYYMRATMLIAGEQIPATVVNAAVKLLAGSTLPQQIITPAGGLITQETFAP